jgi:uncharacterized alkaline shock family protein YloU
MRVFNRAVVILEIVLLIIVLIVAAVVPNTVLERMVYTVGEAQRLLQIDWPRSYIVFLLVDIGVIFLGLVLLWLEIRPQTMRVITVRTRGGAEAQVSPSSVAKSLEYHIADVSDISKARAVVRGMRTGVDISLDLETAPEIDIPSKMEEVSQASRDLIEGRMGLHVARIKVNVKQAAPGKVAAPMPKPTVEPSAEEGAEAAEQPETEFPPGEGDPYSEV